MVTVPAYRMRDFYEGDLDQAMRVWDQSRPEGEPPPVFPVSEVMAAARGGQPAVVFVDLASGSCLVAVLKRLRSEQLVKVVTGVNLAMLVDFVFHRSLSPADAATRAAAAGEKSIRIP